VQDPPLFGETVTDTGASVLMFRTNVVAPAPQLNDCCFDCAVVITRVPLSGSGTVIVAVSTPFEYVYEPRQEMDFVPDGGGGADVLGAAAAGFGEPAVVGRVVEPDMGPVVEPFVGPTVPTTGTGDPVASGMGEGAVACGTTVVPAFEPGRVVARSETLWGARVVGVAFGLTVAAEQPASPAASTRTATSVTSERRDLRRKMDDSLSIVVNR
jgi:hypothetical protein